jgi:hypothetical protein
VSIIAADSSVSDKRSQSSADEWRALPIVNGVGEIFVTTLVTLMIRSMGGSVGAGRVA